TKTCNKHTNQVTHTNKVTNTNTGNTHKHRLLHPGERREAGPPRVMVVLIDGWPSDDLEQAAMLAREYNGLNIYFLIISLLPHTKKKTAVCKDNAHFSYSIPSWFSTTKHVKPLTQRLCSLDGLLCSKTCYNSVNIGFLIDGSSSIGDSNFRMMLDFLAGIARSFDISDIGVRSSHLRPEAGVRPFDHPRKEDTINALRRISYMSGGTATGADGLDRVGTPHHHITDGQSYDDVQLPALEGQKKVSTLQRPEGSAMASEPKEGHTFFTRDFIGLAEIVPAVVRGICRDFNDKN
uniref:Coagulation factor C homolog, cochlin (Limulus polyphemus) n=1 Tax=Sphaeramia orbicularis TaxID=375764 RepID=A0A673CGW1_9TELE